MVKRAMLLPFSQGGPGYPVKLSITKCGAVTKLDINPFLPIDHIKLV